MPVDKTQICCLTPKGRGAIATIIVQGAASLQVIEKCFRSISGKLISESSVGQILFGSWHSPSDDLNVGEDLVVCRVDEQTAEIHCHGGLIAPNNIVSHLVALGCEQVESEAWELSHQSKITNEAFNALKNSPTERTAIFMLEQSRGLLADEIRTISNIAIDDSAVACQRISELLSTSQFGIHLNKYWNVVFAGPPNVGKSSLMNALVGFKRSIVYDQPGTTRDLISIDTALDGWPVRLTDTAGIHDSKIELEAQGIELAKSRMNEADLVINVSDATDKPPDEQFSTESQQVFVRNKCDLLPATPREDRSFIYTSATTGKGIKELVDKIVQCILPIEFSPTVPIVFTARQVDQLQQTLSSLQSGKLDSAQQILHAML